MEGWMIGWMEGTWEASFHPPTLQYKEAKIEKRFFTPKPWLKNRPHRRERELDF